MAIKFQINAKGVKQGAFKGGSLRKGWTDASEGFGLDYKVEAPFDANRGHYSGKRRWQPLLLRKEVDAASPQYITAVTTNETLSTVTIKFWNVTADGKENNHYTIVLTNAAVVGVRTFFGQDATHSEGRDTFEQEEISLAFQAIDVTWTKGGITVHDAWDEPVT